MSEYTALHVVVAGGIASITLDRPELLNRFDATLHVELADCVAELGDQDDVHAIVLASSGSVFSAGGDLELMRRAHADLRDRNRIIDDGRRLLHTLLDVPQPMVVALAGDAIGLGATVVLAAVGVVAARSAGLADPHVQLALVAGDGGCALWPASAGMLVAKRYLLTGDRMPAEHAHALGLVTDLVDAPDDVLPAALALAARIAELPPLAVRGTKRALNHLMQVRAAEVVDLSFALESVTLGSDDLLEAIGAFTERRRPQYEGR